MYYHSCFIIQSKYSQAQNMPTSMHLPALRNEECYCSIYSSYSSRHLSNVIFVCSSQVFEVVAQLFRPRIT